MRKNPARNVNLKSEASPLLEKINNSIDIDKRLYNEDIDGSIAHCQMLAKQKIIEIKESNLIIKSLKQIKNQIKNCLISIYQIICS